MIEAYEKLAAKVPYALHLGVTEAGLARTGTIKSAIGIGTLLYKGIEIQSVYPLPMIRPKKSRPVRIS